MDDENPYRAGLLTAESVRNRSREKDRKVRNALLVTLDPAIAAELDALCKISFPPAEGAISLHSKTGR